MKYGGCAKLECVCNFVNTGNLLLYNAMKEMYSLIFDVMNLGLLTQKKDYMPHKLLLLKTL